MSRMERTWHLADATALPEVAAAILQWSGERRKFAFRAPMGAGKTTLTRHLCAALGCTAPVSSPTFALAQSYPSPIGALHHLDLYRLKNAQEAYDAGILEFLEDPNYAFIEWPDLIVPFLPESTVHLTIDVGPEEWRTIFAHAEA